MWKLKRDLDEKLSNCENEIEEIIKQNSKSKANLIPLQISARISVIYLILGCLWILLSDRLVSWFIADGGLLMFVSTVKGWFYVLVSACIIFCLVFHQMKRIKRTEKMLIDSYHQLCTAHEELESAYEEIAASEEELKQQFDQLMESQQMLLESEERYRLISEAANDAIWEEKDDERHFSDRWFEITGYSREDMEQIGNWESLIHLEDIEVVRAKLNEYKQQKSRSYSCEYRIRRKDGEYIWLQDRGKAIFDGSGKVCRMVGSHTDINELKNSQEKLRFLAYHDLLTGLPNKIYLQENLRDIFNSSSKSTALICINIDNFTNINNTMGHLFGDKVIVKVSERLALMLAEKCSIYRLDGDEFIIIVPDIEDAAEAERFAESILNGFREGFEINGSILHINLSIGIAVYPEHGKCFSDLMKYAVIAMRNSKEWGKGRYVLYNQQMKETVAERMLIEKHLHSAIENDEFMIYYQPQVDLKQSKITGFEALLRWNSPELGFVPPLKFINIAEETHLIVPLGYWILKNACAFIKELHQRGFTGLTVSVNISILQLLQANFVDMIKDILKSLDLAPQYLELEITESMLIESFDEVDKKLRNLQELGIKTALDDFGKGYSSLSYLRQLSISTLKIDKSFVDCISTETENNTLIGYIVKIGNSMGMSVIAEGVETKEQLEFLMQNGCHKVQGYIFSRPIPKEQVIKLLETGLYETKEADCGKC